MNFHSSGEYSRGPTIAHIHSLHSLEKPIYLTTLRQTKKHLVQQIMRGNSDNTATILN